MICYRLRCERDHEFEAWFASSEAYDRQAKAGLVSCPLCGSVKVEKAPMAPAIARSRGTARAADEDGESRKRRTERLYRLMRAVQRYVEENYEHVGRRFAEEARRIHYGESEPRGIYGEASRKEVKELLEEEIPVAPLPRLPDLDA